VKAAVTSETQLASSDLATVAECIAYLRDRVPWPVDEIFSFQQKKGEKGECSLSLLVQLVGGLEHFLFFHILEIIIPIDKLIFFRRVAKNHQPDV